MRCVVMKTYSLKYDSIEKNYKQGYYSNESQMTIKTSYLMSNIH